MHVAFLAIGDEILRGNTRETNGHHLAVRLERLGVALRESRHVSDLLTDVVGAVHELAERSQLVLITGGLGPTDDDQTRQALAEVAAVPLELDSVVLAQLEQRYSQRGRDFTETNRRQAYFPRGAAVLHNDFGTAPGFSMVVGQATVACFPGVPREFLGMLTDHLDTLLGAAGITSSPRDEHILRIFGITESALQEQIAQVPGYDQITIRSLPRFPEIRLYTSGPAHIWPQWLAEVRAGLGWRVFCEDANSSIGDVLRRQLSLTGATIAIAESCTGGLIGDLLTDAPGMSAHLLADLVCYSDAAKTALLGVDAALIEREGAVSEAVARAMAEGARARTGADFAVATTGIAGPGGGSADKPVGTICLAVSHAGGCRSWRHTFPGLNRRRFKLLVAWMALARLRQTVHATRPTLGSTTPEA